MFINILMLIGGLAVLVKGSDIFIEAASEIAKRLGISQMIIGLTLVAFGTSLPEWISSLIAASRDPSDLPCASDCASLAETTCTATDLALGNVIGSNIANIGMVLGIVGVVITVPIIASKKFLMRDIPLLITLAVLSWYFATIGNRIERWEGLIMFLIFLGVTTFTFMEAASDRESEEENDSEESEESQRRYKELRSLKKKVTYMVVVPTILTAIFTISFIIISNNVIRNNEFIMSLQ